MCYFIHGAAYGNIDADEYEKVAAKYEFRFKLGTKHDVKNDVANDGYDFCVTNRTCDCDSPVGAKDPTAPELKKYEALLNDLKNVRGLKHIYLCKVWAGDVNKKEATLKLRDINVPDFLANVKEKCLYTIEMQ